MDIFDIAEHQKLYLAPTPKQVRGGRICPIEVFVIAVSKITGSLECKHTQAPYKRLHLLADDVVPTSDEYFAAARDLCIAEKRKARVRYEATLRKLDNAMELAAAKTTGKWTK